MSEVVATEELYLTADRTQLVRAGDPRARFLFAYPGRPITAEQMREFPGGLPGVSDGAETPEPVSSEPTEDEEKPEPAVTDKSVRGPKEPRKR